MQHHAGIGQVNFLGKIQHRLLLGRAESGKIGTGLLCRSNLLLGLGLGRGNVGEIGGQGQFGNLFIHGSISPLFYVVIFRDGANILICPSKLKVNCIYKMLQSIIQ